MSLYLGIDTSNYTTSFAVCGDMDISVRKLLDVPEGARGVRQSDGVFMHLKNAPGLYSELKNKIDVSKIKAVGVSTRPRNVDGSYMLVFVCGESYASMIADTLGVPLYSFSHQEGHVMAGVKSCENPELLKGDFHAVHLSGGTCEILKVKSSGFGFDTEIVGESLDISAGQLIDRAGVAMGMRFPAGREVSSLAEKYDGKVPKLSVTVKDGKINFSGAETQILKLINNSDDNMMLSRAVLDCVSESILKALAQVGAEKVLMVGGVASSDYIRKYLSNKGKKIEFLFAKPEYSTDNAWGIAKLTERRNGYGT